jgi:uncharacterized membrane protein
VSALDDRGRQALYTVAAIVLMGAAVAMVVQAWSAGAEYDRRRRRDAADMMRANDALRERVAELEGDTPEEVRREHNGERGER